MLQITCTAPTRSYILFTGVSRASKCIYINSANSITGPLQSEYKKAECVCHTCPVGCSMPVLVVMCETCEAGHGTRVVVSDPLNHLPHLLPSLLFFEDPGFLVACDAFPRHTHTHTQNSSCRSKHWRPSNGPTGLLCGCRHSNVNDSCCWRLHTDTLIKRLSVHNFKKHGSPEGVKVASSVPQLAP